MFKQFVKSVHYRRLFNQAAVPRDLEICREFIRPGDTVLDLGANIGIYTKALAELVGPAGQVHAVELMPLTFEYLHSNLAAFENVFCYNAGMSDKTGIGHAYQPPRSKGHIYQARISTNGTRVRLYRVDDLFSDLLPSFIKCDVEDHELAVIEGAKDLILHSHPAWLMETDNLAVFERMAELGYRRKQVRHDWLFTYEEVQYLRKSS